MSVKSLGLKIFSIAALLALSACNPAKPYMGSSADFFWESDQTRISPEDGSLNVWSGFTVEMGVFRASDRDSSLALWRRAPVTNARLEIEYQLRGNPAVFSSPGLKATPRNLAISPDFRCSDFRIDLRSGLNVLVFRTRPGSQLKIREVRLGDPTKRKHLENGDSLLLCPPPGTGELTLKGKGQVEIQTTLFGQGKEKLPVGKMKTGWFSSTLKIPFSLADRGCLKITSVSGRFTVSAYSSRPAPRQPALRPSRFAAKPDVFIFLLDACQAAHLGAYGYPRPTSPHLDRLAREAMVFENAYANATFTKASVPSFFTGLFPDSDDVFPRAKLTLQQFLKSQDYAVSILSTSFFVSDFVGFPRQGTRHFEYFADWHLPLEKERIVRRFCALLEPPAPRFVYLHYLEPHLPIVPPPPFRDMFKAGEKTDPSAARTFGKLPDPGQRTHNDQWELFFDPAGKKDEKDQVMFKLWHDKNYRHSRDLTPEQVQKVVDDYDSSIAYIDAEVGKLLSCLKAKNIYDDSMIVIMADHGEALYEHKEWFHGNNVYDETSRVPMIVKFPKKMGLQGRSSAWSSSSTSFPPWLTPAGYVCPWRGGACWSRPSIPLSTIPWSFRARAIKFRFTACAGRTGTICTIWKLSRNNCLICGVTAGRMSMANMRNSAACFSCG